MRTRLLARGGEIECVFDWSFYSQGERERGAVSADNFVREALRFFGDVEPMHGSHKMRVELGDWTNAARSAGDLSELELTLGRTSADVRTQRSRWSTLTAAGTTISPS